MSLLNWKGKSLKKRTKIAGFVNRNMEYLAIGIKRCTNSEEILSHYDFPFVKPLDYNVLNGHFF